VINDEPVCEVKESISEQRRRKKGNKLFREKLVKKEANNRYQQKGGR